MTSELVLRLQERSQLSGDDPYLRDLAVDAAERIEVLEATLRKLVDACAYVSPIVGAVATEPSVKHIRNAGRFVEAVDRARRVLGEHE